MQGASQSLFHAPDSMVWSINERRRAERELRDYQDHLEQVVEERTADLKEAKTLLEELS